MKKTIVNTLTAVALIVPGALSAGESVPYTSDIGSNYSLCPGWQNVTRSDNYWSYDRDSDFSTPGTSGGMMHPWEPEDDADAMLISPAIELTEGASYVVSFWAKTTGNATNEREAFKLFMGPTGTMSALKATTPLISVSDYYHNDDFELFSATFTASASCDTYFGIYCCSESYQGNLSVTGFSVKADGQETPDTPETVKELPYVADFTSQESFGEWTSLAGPGAASAMPWHLNTYVGFAEFDSSEGVAEDNYFISPALNLSDAGQYLVTLEYTAQGTFDIVLGTDKTDPASFTTVLMSENDVTKFNEIVELPVQITEPGKYYVAMHLKAAAGSYFGYRMHAFKIKRNLAVPAVVTDLKAVADATDQLNATLTWTNPALDNLGNPLDAITAIEITRNGEPVATLTDNLTPGAQATYTDNVPAAGAYAYTVIVRNANGALDAEPMTASAGFVGRPTAAFPYSIDIDTAPADQLELFTAEDANNDGLGWEVVTQYYRTSFTSVNGDTPETESADNYLASPYLHLMPGYYLFTSSISARCNNFEVGIATDRHDLAGTFTKLGGINDQQEYGYNDYKVIIPIDNEGDYCLVWRHTGMSTNYAYKSVGLGAVSLVEQALLPGTATALGALAEPGQFEARVGWTNPEADNAGRPLTSLTRIEIARDGEVIATLTDAENLVPGARCSYTDKGMAESGEYTYTVTVYNANGCAEEDAPKFTAFIGTGEAIPYTADFNDWTIVNGGASYAWAVDTDNSIFFARGTYDDVVYDDGIYSPFILFENGKRYILTFKTFGTDDMQQGQFTLQLGTSRDFMFDIAEYNVSGMAEQEHTLALLPRPHDLNDASTADGNEILVPVGNLTIGFHVGANTAANIRDFSIVPDPNYDAIREVTGNHLTAVCNGGILTFSAPVSAVTVTDIAGRTLFSGAGCDTVDLRGLAESSLLIVSARGADGSSVTLKLAR